jgi:protein-arginine deiminase
LIITISILLVGATGAVCRTRKIESPDDIESIKFLSANNIPLKLIVAYVQGGNDDFVTDIIKLVKEIHENDKFTRKNPFKVHIVPGPKASKNDFAELRERISDKILKQHVKFNQDYVTNDVWMQDWGEVGVVKLKTDPKAQLLVFDSNRGRRNSKLPKLLSKFWNSYYLKNPSHKKSTGDYGGNIEATPDNILVVGNTSTKALREFLNTHGYKDRMVIVETDWLNIGHCDEYISIAPNPKSKTGYTIIRANPRLALKLIKDTSKEELEQISHKDYREKLLAVKDYLTRKARPLSSISENRDNRQITLADIVSCIDDQGNIPEKYISMRLGVKKETNIAKEVKEFISINLALATVIDTNIENLKKKIASVNKAPLEKQSFVSYPVLYHTKGGKHIAFIPGTVNQLILNKHLVIPDPLIKSFRQNISKTTKKLGLKAHFINNMPYHLLDGEIHCGTNVFRHPNKYFVKPR